MARKKNLIFLLILYMSYIEDTRIQFFFHFLENEIRFFFYIFIYSQFYFYNLSSVKDMRIMLVNVYILHLVCILEPAFNRRLM